MGDVLTGRKVRPVSQNRTQSTVMAVIIAITSRKVREPPKTNASMATVPVTITAVAATDMRFLWFISIHLLSYSKFIYVRTLTIHTRH